MDINVLLKDNIAVINLIGKLNINSYDYFENQIIGLINPGSKLIFDMSKCEYISNSGLRVLLNISRKLDKVGGTGVFVGLQDEISDIMEITGFDNIFNNFDSQMEALKFLNMEKNVC